MKVLIADDQPAVCAALQLLFDLHGLPSVVVNRPEDALDLIATEDIGTVVQDMNFTQERTSGEEGVALFRAIKKLDPDLPVVLLTAWSSLETAVQLVKEGASDYMAKPWDDEKLARVVKNLVSMRALQQENTRLLAQRSRLRRTLAARYDLSGLVYVSDTMHGVVSLACTIASSDAPVLITGPNGSGKERLAEIVQANSRRKDKPFVKVNAGALPDDLLEAELFGAEAGAFTGANKSRIGRFEAAHGGTLFLDEIGNLSLAGQAKLLRVLQTGEFERLGSSGTRKVDVRIVSATNTDLPRAIAAGAFREDLYFRLNVIELPLPPLGERPDDVMLLADHFLATLPGIDGAPPRASIGRGAGHAGPVRVAGQRARAAEPDPPRQADRGRRGDPDPAPRHPAGRRASARRARAARDGRPDAVGRAADAGVPRDAHADTGRRRQRSRARHHRAGAGGGGRRRLEGGGRDGRVAPGALPAHGAARYRAGATSSLSW